MLRIFRRLHIQGKRCAAQSTFRVLPPTGANKDKPWSLAPDVASRTRRNRVERVSPIPFGVGFTKPHNYWEVLRTAWENKRNPVFTWRILRDGVCDGCALGTTGMRDFTMKGIHLCTVRLNLLPLNTMGPLDVRVLEDVASPRPLSSRPAGPRPPPVSDAPAPRGERIPSHSLGRGPRDRGAPDPGDHAESRRVLRHIPRHDERVLLRREQGRAVPRHESHRQLEPPVPLAEHDGP